MKDRHIAQRPFRPRWQAHRSDQHPRDQLSQVPAPIEAPGGLGQVAMGLFAESEGVVGPVQRALEVAQHDIDPTAVGLLSGLPTLARQYRVPMPVLGQQDKGAGAIAIHLAARRQPGLAPLADSRLGEAGDRIDDRLPWPPRGSGHGNQKGRVFSEPRPGLPPLRSPPR